MSPDEELALILFFLGPALGLSGARIRRWWRGTPAAEFPLSEKEKQDREASFTLYGFLLSVALQAFGMVSMVTTVLIQLANPGLSVSVSGVQWGDVGVTYTGLALFIVTLPRAQDARIRRRLLDRGVKILDDATPKVPDGAARDLDDLPRQDVGAKRP